MRWTGFGFRRGYQVPLWCSSHNLEGEPVESDVWLNQKNAPRWVLTQSTALMPYYDQALVLICAERVEACEVHDDPELAPPDLPSFR